MVDDQEISARNIKHQRDEYYTGVYTTSCNKKEEDENKQPKTTPLNQIITSKPSVKL